MRRLLSENLKCPFVDSEFQTSANILKHLRRCALRLEIFRFNFDVFFLNLNSSSSCNPLAFPSRRKYFYTIWNRLNSFASHLPAMPSKKEFCKQWSKLQIAIFGRGSETGCTGFAFVYPRFRVSVVKVHLLRTKFLGIIQ